jgi:hypothetical protein
MPHCSAFRYLCVKKPFVIAKLVLYCNLIYPHDESNPKETLINLAWRCRKKAIRDDMIPTPRSGRSVGMGYANRISEFVMQSEYTWRLGLAAEASDSLRRGLTALERWL